jgi:hypothetical protein
MIRLTLGIVVLLCTVSPAFAQGGGREWLEKMSGPELVGTEFRVQLFCVWSNRNLIWQFDGQGISKLLSDGDKKADRRFCVDVGYASFNNSDRAAAGELVNLQRLEGAVAYRFDSLNRKGPWWGALMAFEPGVGVGVLKFLTDGGSDYRFEVSPRIVIKPLRLFPGIRTHRWSNVFSYGFRGQWTPAVTNADIGVVGYQPFRDGWLTGQGFAINLGELLR